MAKNSNGGTRTARKPKNRQPWLIAGVTALGLVAVAVYSAAGQQGPDQVERFMHLHGLAAPGWAPGEVYVASHQGLVRIDAQGEWGFVSEVRHDFMGFQANPLEEGVLYSSGHPGPGSNLPNPLGFMVSRDAGATWENVALLGQVDFHVMTVQPTNGDVIYGYSGGLMRSLDAGKNWERIAGDVARIGNVYALAVHPDDAGTVLAGTNSGLWRSEDAGKSWTNILPQVPVTALSFAEDLLWAYAVNPNAGLIVSGDDGESWRSLGFFLEGDDAVAYIAPRPGNPDELYLGSFGQNIYESADGGESWEALALAGVPEEHSDAGH